MAITSFHNGLIIASDKVLMTPKGIAPKRAFPEPITSKPFKWVQWGEDNLFPQNIVRQTAESTIIAPAIDKQVRYSYAGGIQAGKIQIIDNEEVFTPVIDKDFNDFKIKSNLNAYVLEALSDLYWFTNLFPNIVLSKDRSKIVQLFIEEACYCRWEWPDEKGLVKNCFVSANWEKTTPPDKEIITLPVIDKYFDPVGQIRASKNTHYVFPLSYPSPNKHFYQLAPWHGAIASNWLSFSLQIPKFKEAMMKNQLSIKYHLQVNEDYWPSLYDGWINMSPEEQQTSKKAFLESFTKTMSDTENANKTLLSQFFYDSLGNKREAWIITPVDDKMKSGIYVEDSQEASTHIMNAFGLDTALFGNGPGKGFSSGSGSDKNSAYNLYMASIEPHHDIILEPLYLIRDFNGWDSDLQFRFRKTFMSSSTSGKPTMQPAN